MVKFAKYPKEILPYPYTGGTKSGTKVLIRLSDLGCTTFADTGPFRRELSDAKQSWAQISSVGQRRLLIMRFKVIHKTYLHF